MFMYSMWWSVFLNLFHALVWPTEAGQMRERNQFQNVPSTQYQKQMFSNCTWLATRCARDRSVRDRCARGGRDADDKPEDVSLSLCFMKTSVQIPWHTYMTDSSTALFLCLAQSSQPQLCSGTLLVGVPFTAGTCSRWSFTATEWV